jgi:hypothetical protein
MSRIALIAIALLGATQLLAEPRAHSDSNRFAMRSSSLEAATRTTTDDRFRLSAHYQRHERPVVSESVGLRLEGKLLKDTSGSCVMPALLFSDGFEPSD